MSDAISVKWNTTTISAVTLSVGKINPADDPEKEIEYVDISSINNAELKIVETKKLLGKNAPSRARQLIRFGDTVFSTVRPYLKNIARVPDTLDCQVASTGFCVLRPSPKVLSRYLFYFVQSASFLREITKFQRGVSYPAVRNEDVLQQEIPLPPTFEDQQQIVAEIEKQFSRLDEAVASLKRIQANLKRYKAAVLKAAVEGKLTEEWRRKGALHAPLCTGVATSGRTQCAPTETGADLLKRILAERRAKWEAEELAKMKVKGRVGAHCMRPDDSWKKKYKEPAGPDTANLPELPEGWVWAKSDQLFSFVTSGSRGWASYYSETGPIFLRMGNLDHDSIQLDLTDIQRVQPPEGAEGLRTRVAAGDILISITADVGMVGMVPVGFEEAFINQHVSLARPISAVNSTFIAWFLACKAGQDQFKELQRGATKVGLGLDDIKSVNVPMPPVEEQKAILAEIDRRLSVTEELETTIETNLKRAERLRQTILQRAFSGGLAV